MSYKIFVRLFLKVSLYALISLAFLSSCKEHKIRTAPKTKNFQASQDFGSAAVTDDDFTLTDSSDPESLLIEKELEKEGVPIIAVIGTGKFFKLSTIGDVKGPGDPEDKVYLNFKDADIPSMTRMILSEILNIEYDLDPNIKGTASFVTSKPVPRHKLLGIFQNIMADNNLSLLEINTKIYVMSEEKRYSDNAPRIHGTQKIGDKSILPIKLHYVSATQISSVLKPLIAGEASIQIDSTRNMIIASGNPQGLLTVNEMVKMFDVDWLAGMSFAIFPLDVADAGTVIFELEKIFDKENAALDDIFRFVPLERLNSIMVITKQPEYFDRIAQWIKRLDYGEKQNGYGLHVYYLTNTKAASMASMLQDLFIDGLPSANEGGVEINEDKNLKSTKSDDRRDNYIKQTSTKNFSAPTIGGVRIIPDEENNALIVKSNSSDYRMIEAAIKRLDLPPIQVMIEATIAQVALNDNLQFGLSGFFNQDNVALGFNGGGLAATAANAAIDKGFKFVFKSKNVASTLEMVKEITDVEILSSPYAMVHNNKTADIKIGRQVPVLTQQSTSIDSATAPTLQQIEFRDTGIKLTVTPRVSNEGKVTLDIIQEVTEEETSGSSNNSAAKLNPAFKDQKLNTIVTVQSGDTVALGGLIRDEKSKGRSGIPLLMDIPLLGHLFSSSKIVSDRSELLVLISPKIIKNDEQSLVVTKELKERLSLIQKIKFEGHKLFPEKITEQRRRQAKRDLEEISEKYFNNDHNKRPRQEERFVPLSSEMNAHKKDEDDATDYLEVAKIHQHAPTMSVLSKDEDVKPQSLLASKGRASKEMPQTHQTASRNIDQFAQETPSVPLKKIRVKTYEDRDLAEEEWIRLSRKFSKDLDFSTIQVFHNNINQTGFRLESEGVDEVSANNFCNVMREKGEECQVIASP